MIQRHSPTIRRDESIEEYSPPPLSGEYTHDTSPPSQQQMQQQHISYEQHPKDQQPPVKKSRGRPTKQYWTHEWSDHATEALIELWSEKEELYNKQHPLFYVKENKDRAVEEIKDSLRDRGFDVTCNNILSKFQSLRTYFCTQRTKHMAQRRASGGYHMMSQDDGNECKWRFYKSLMFLDDNMKPRESHRKMELINAEYCAPPSFATSGPGSGGSTEIMVTRTRPGYTSSHHHHPHHHQQPPPSQTMVEYLHPHEQPSPDGYLNSGNSSGGANSISGGGIGGGNPHNQQHRESGSTSPYDDHHQQQSAGSLSSRDYTVSSSYQDSLNDIAKNGGSGLSKHLTSSSSSINTNNNNKPLKQDKHEDFIFGELVGNMVHQLPSGKHKDLVKLEIQQLIIKAKYASKNEEDIEDGSEIKTETEG